MASGQSTRLFQTGRYSCQNCPLRPLRVFREFEKQDQAYRKAKGLWPEVELDADYKQRILQLCGYEY